VLLMTKPREEREYSLHCVKEADDRCDQMSHFNVPSRTTKANHREKILNSRVSGS